MRISRGLLVTTAMMALGTISYLAFSVDDTVALTPTPSPTPTPTQAIPENRETPAVDPVMARANVETAATLLMRPDTEMVLGMEVRKDRTCTLIERYIEMDDGTLLRGDESVVIFHAGTRRSAAGGFETCGGRVLGVTARGGDVEEARDRVYKAVSDISFEGAQLRRDIAARALDR